MAFPTPRFDNDVHSFTRQLCQRLRDDGALLALFNAPLTNYTTLYTYVGDFFEDPRVDSVLGKMRDRTTHSTGQYGDPHLFSININRILLECWRCCVNRDSFNPLHETLVEMAGHCIQGDSHRLLVLFLALREPFSNPNTRL